MQAGEFNRRIQIFSPTTAQDEFGEEVKTMALRASVWAKFKAMTGRETMTADQNTGILGVNFIIRSTEIDRLCEIHYNSDIYRVVEVLQEDRGLMRIIAQRVS